MLQVTWEWLGVAPALDVANTVAVSKGVAHDLLAPPGEYERWAEAAARQRALETDTRAVLLEARPRVLRMRGQIREVLAAAAAGEPLPEAAVAELNRASSKAPSWPELDHHGQLCERTRGSAADRLLGSYARSAIEIAAEDGLRVCPAPSCGMYYRPSRERQRWCSAQCGTRARVARHSRRRRA
jgi:predicted RNA-binding Zn ribbon-like protein